MTDPITCLALAIYFEARSEPIAGQYMVANTIQNRVGSVRYPNTICDVVKQKHQFSFYWDGKPEKVANMEAWNVAVKVAEWSLTHEPSYYSGCHYHADYVSPSWAKAYKPVMVSGKHYFYEGGC